MKNRRTTGRTPSEQNRIHKGSPGPDQMTGHPSCGSGSENFDSGVRGDTPLVIRDEMGFGSQPGVRGTFRDRCYTTPSVTPDPLLHPVMFRWVSDRFSVSSTVTVEGRLLSRRHEYLYSVTGSITGGECRHRLSCRDPT